MTVDGIKELQEIRPTGLGNALVMTAAVLSAFGMRQITISPGAYLVGWFMKESL